MKWKEIPKSTFLALAILATIFFQGISASQAADATIAKQAEPQAIDPHFSRMGSNQDISEHIFDRLVQPDDTSAWPRHWRCPGSRWTISRSNSSFGRE